MLNHNPSQLFIDSVNYFDDHYGFGSYKEEAIFLLRKTIEILDHHSIHHMLISGSLLGLRRHNGLIPWDDDIDLLVNNNVDKLWLKDLGDILIYKMWSFYKSCRISGIKTIVDEDLLTINKDKCLTWPSIDLFTYELNGDKIVFFEKEWPSDQFIPTVKSSFEGINVNIPNNPDYFLQINYGHDYMHKCISRNWNHKADVHVPDLRIIDLRDLS